MYCAKATQLEQLASEKDKQEAKLQEQLSNCQEDKANEGACAASSATLVRGATNRPRSRNTTAKKARLPRRKIPAVFICSACHKSFDTRKGLYVHFAVHVSDKSSIPTPRVKFKITPVRVQRRRSADAKTKSKRQR